jgi:Protein of unknown function (DUF1501)/Planctomycete cytochrome C
MIFLQRFLCLWSFALVIGAADPAADPDGIAFFEAKIRPVLAEKCYECHSAAKKIKAKLSLDSRAGVLEGGETGPAIVPGDPEKSLLIKAIRYHDEDLQMPPKKQLASSEVEDFVAWIKRGAPDPRDAALKPVNQFNDAAMKNHWAYRPLVRPSASQRAQLDLLSRIDRCLADGDNEREARSESFKLAYRMQTSAPEALNIDAEPAHVREMYGINDKNSDQYGRQCLIARRLIERGVRCVQIYSGGMDNDNSWDGHADIVKNHRGFASETDKPIAGLLADLAQRGLLDQTLVIWGGEFGRLPVAQGKGRDHNPHAFTTWFAGGGVKAGVHHGATDEIGHKAVEGRVSVHDLHATILHLMGMDHERLTYHFNGRDYRLTDVEGKVVKAILA